jgi:hypothetical protein
MCTLTVLPRPALAGRSGLDEAVLRVVCNRDERLARVAALPPAAHLFDGRQVAMPIDPEGGGTWIAANDRGLVLTLLNATADLSAVTAARTTPGRPSRGLIIPALASSESVSEALDRALAMNLWRFNPFRLVLLDRHQLAECWLENGLPRYRRAFLHAPLMRTSSSLGDGLVQAPRRALFRRFFEGAADPRAAQDAFHDHQWPGRESISVRMERADARTVSRTVVEVSDEVTRLRYRAIGHESDSRLSIPLISPARLAARCS